MTSERAPQFRVGDYLTIYCGLNEGCCFYVKSMRWADADQWRPAGWEYDTGQFGWRRENTVSTEAFARLFP